MEMMDLFTLAFIPRVPAYKYAGKVQEDRCAVIIIQQSESETMASEKQSNPEQNQRLQNQQMPT